MCHCQVSLEQRFFLYSAKSNIEFLTHFSFLPLLEKTFPLIFIFPFSIFAGDICGGQCCDNKTETDVLRKSIKIFEGLIKHQLKSLKGLWESTYSTYKGKREFSVKYWMRIDVRHAFFGTGVRKQLDEGKLWEILWKTEYIMRV